jgi:hypothetical protein
MPYGVSDAAWAAMSEEERQHAIYEYNQSQTVIGTGTGSTSGGDLYEELLGGAPVIPPSSGDSSGGGGSGAPSAQDLYEEQLYWLNQWISSPTFQETGGLPFASGPGSFFGNNQEALNQALVDLGYGGTTGQGIIPTSNFGGGGAAPTTAVFSEADINISGAPEWWRALIPDVNNPISNYQTLSNLMIPLLSPEDQRTVATNLFQSDPEAFALYDPEALDPAQVPGEITPELRRQFFTGERAQDALGAFDQLLATSGKTAEDFGPGYNYLRSIADTIGGFGLTSGANQLCWRQEPPMPLKHLDLCLVALQIHSSVPALLQVLRRISLVM